MNFMGRAARTRKIHEDSPVILYQNANYDQTIQSTPTIQRWAQSSPATLDPMPPRGGLKFVLQFCQFAISEKAHAHQEFLGGARVLGNMENLISPYGDFKGLYPQIIYILMGSSITNQPFRGTPDFRKPPYEQARSLGSQPPNFPTFRCLEVHVAAVVQIHNFGHHLAILSWRSCNGMAPHEIVGALAASCRFAKAVAVTWHAVDWSNSILVYKDVSEFHPPHFLIHFLGQQF